MKHRLQFAWKRIYAVSKAIRKDIKTILAVAEIFSYLGLLGFGAMVVNLTLRNEPLNLNGFGLLSLLFSIVGVTGSLAYGYWEHLLKSDQEWER